MVFGALAAAALFMAFYPKRPEFFLYRLSKSFGIAERASEYPLKDEWFFVRSALERARLDAYFTWQYVRFDVNIDNDGIWMAIISPEPGKCAPSMLVPWKHVRFVKHWLNHSYFTFLADEPVGITVRKSLGEKIVRCMPPWQQ